MTDDKVLTQEEKTKYLRQGQGELAELFIDALIDLVKSEPTFSELNFWKSTIHMPNGGAYILSFMHVDGPKIAVE